MTAFDKSLTLNNCSWMCMTAPDLNTTVAWGEKIVAKGAKGNLNVSQHEPSWACNRFESSAVFANGHGHRLQGQWVGSSWVLFPVVGGGAARCHTDTHLWTCSIPAHRPKMTQVHTPHTSVSCQLGLLARCMHLSKLIQNMKICLTPVHNKATL